MLLKLGVSIERLNREIRRALDPVDAVYHAGGEEVVITSTFEGDHKAGSLHYSNDAFDVRMPKNKPGDVAQEIRRRLGKDFDVVLELDHIHCEYDPK
jgi:hypothetical protein